MHDHAPSLARRLLACLPLLLAGSVEARPRPAVAAGGSLGFLVEDSARIVEARVVAVHAFAPSNGWESTAPVPRLVELEISTVLLGPPDERSALVVIDGDDPTERRVRASEQRALWTLHLGWRSGDELEGADERIRALGRGRNVYRCRSIEGNVFPLETVRGQAVVALDEQRFYIPGNLPVLKGRDPDRYHLRRVPRSELYALLRALVAELPLELTLTRASSRWRGPMLAIGRKGQSTVTDDEGRTRNLCFTPEELQSLRAVLDRERFEHLPRAVGKIGAKDEDDLELEVRSPFGRQRIRIGDTSGTDAPPEEREAIGRAHRVLRALGELFEQHVEDGPVAPPDKTRAWAPHPADEFREFR